MTANGKTCFLVLCVYACSGECVASYTVPNTFLLADAWSHIAILHSYSGVDVYVNGRRRDFAAAVSFPREPTRRQRLEISFGVGSVFGGGGGGGGGKTGGGDAAHRRVSPATTPTATASVVASGSSDANSVGRSERSDHSAHTSHNNIAAAAHHFATMANIAHATTGMSNTTPVDATTAAAAAAATSTTIRSSSSRGMQNTMYSSCNNHGSTSHATTMRGLSSSLSFFGYVTHMDLLDGMITEKDVMRIAAAGPHCRGACTYNLTTMLSIRANESAQTTDSALPLVVSGSFLSHNESVSVHGVLTFTPVNVSAVFAQEKVAEWALRTMREHHHSPHFTQVAKLCMTFLMTAMRLTHGTAELETVLSDGLMDRLQAEILSWEEAFLEFSALALTAVTPRGAGKVLRQHASTQVMLNTLLAMLRAGRLGAMVLTCILRELSDCLLVPENVSLFRAVPGRFEEVLYISLTLPRECTHSVVFLIEKLCKSPAELEQTLRFLLLPQDGVSAEAAKEGIMRMLYDVARANRELCDLIAAAGKGNGVIFLMAMVNGMNHSSETIRVFALRLISLLLHVNKKLRGSFVKSHSFMLLAKAITDPLSSVPITLPTLDCLFRMAFDSFGPTEKSSETAIASRLGLLTKTKNRVMSSGKLFDAVPVTGSSGMDGEGTTAGSKRAMWGGNEAMHANNSTAHNSTNNSSANVNHSSIGPIHTTTTAAIATSSSGSNNNNNGGGCAYANRATLQGYFPGLNLRLLSHTRREYSFELGLDYNGGEDVLRAEDDYDRHAELPPQLVVPHAFQTALSVLGCLVLSTFASASHRGGAGGGSGILATAALAAIAPSLPLDDPATATRATSRLRCVGSPTAHPGVVAPSARDEATATRSGARETTGEDGHSPMLTQDELELSLSGREAESPDSNTATTAETPPSMTRLPGGSSNTGKSNRNNDDDKINGARRDNNPTGHCHENSNCSTGGDDTRHGGGAITESNTHNNRCRCQTDNNNNINNSSNKNNNDPDNDSSSPANKNNKSISKSNSNSNSTGCAQLSGGSRASHPNEAKLKCVRRWVDADSTPHTTIPSASRTSSCAATGGGGAGAVGAAGLSGGELESREGTDGTSETGVSVSMNGAVQDGTGSYYSYGSRKAGSGAAENVVRSVLRYLEKVLDVSSNAEALLPFAWLDWLWSAMAPVMVSQHTPPPSAPTVHGGGSSSTTTTTTNTAATATTTTTTTMATNATGGGLPRRKFVIAARAATRTIIRKMIIFDMRRNSKAKTVLRLRARSFSPVLVRLILEEVARYFAKGSHWQPADQMEAHHLIKNMDILFANVEGLLQPFPPTLGIEIVAAINFFALSNTTLVRMRMKNHSTLFQTRDQLAFYNVVSIPRYARMTYKLLEQLIDANAYHLDTMTVLLDRLVTAVGAMELDEVEVQIRLIRHLVLTDEGQQDELYRVLGQPGVVLANYLCRGPDEMMAPGTSRATGNSSIIVDNHSTSVSGLPFALGAPPVAAHAAQAGLVAARVPRETMGGLLAGRFQGSGHVCNPRERRGSAASTTTRTRTSTPPPPPSNDATTTTDDGREAHMAFSAASAPTIAPPAESYTSARCGASAQHGSETGELTMNHRCPHYPSSPITAIVGWCQAHVAICDAIHHAAQRIIRGRLATMRGIGERGERDRAYLARAARAETERADHKEAKLEAEFKRLMAEVQAQIGGHV